MTGITSGPLEVRREDNWVDVLKDEGPNGMWAVATFFSKETNDGTAEANARAFVMVEQMVGALRAIAGIENIIEDRHALDDDLAMINYKHIRNARAILAQIDGSAGHD